MTAPDRLAMLRLYKQGECTRGCGRPLFAGGLCKTCYAQQYRVSNPRKIKSAYAQEVIQEARAKRKTEKGRAGVRLRVNVPWDVYVRLQAYCKKKGMNIAGLARELLAAVKTK